MFTSAEERCMERLRRKTVERLADDSRKVEARRACQLAADRISRMCHPSIHSSNDPLAIATTTMGGDNDTAMIIPKIPSFELSMDSSSGASSIVSGGQSFERATRRGWRRGSREANEAMRQQEMADAISTTGGSREGDRSEFDLTTITETITDFSGRKNGRKGLRRNRNHDHDATDQQKQKRRALGSLSSTSLDKRRLKKGPVPAAIVGTIQRFLRDDEPETDAWMCGVCGRAYATLDAANKHESNHIREVVAGLGWWSEGGVDPTTSRPSDSAMSQLPINAPHVFRSGVTTIAEEATAMAPGGTLLNRIGSPLATPAIQPIPPFRLENGDDDKDQPPPPILDAEVPSDALVPKPRARSSSDVRFEQLSLDNGGGAVGAEMNPFFLTEVDAENPLLLSNSIRDFVVLADEALINVCSIAEPMILNKTEWDAERELFLLAKDKAYYDGIAKRASDRRSHHFNRYRSEAEGILGIMQNKLVDAYQIMKESEGQRGIPDEYVRKKKDGVDIQRDIEHNDRTIYVNVMIRNSVRVVKHEIERLARERWEEVEVHSFNKFEQFRVYAHAHFVKLAGLALASDLTPRRIAVQLSNDLYRLLTPRLKRRGVTVETEIEYRVGPYFVLAINVTSIDWRRLIKFTHRGLVLRKATANRRNKHDEEDESNEKKNSNCLSGLYVCLTRLYVTPFNDVLAQILAGLYHFPWIVYWPICYIAYITFLGDSIRQFILSSVADEFFLYVEEKGMEMEIRTSTARKQAAFMLAALREIRADGRELQKKRQETESEQKGSILGPLLGPAIKDDAGPAAKPEGFEVPENLEFVGLELDLPVGFRRLRWAMLSRDSTFLTEALYRTEAKYENINLGTWNKHSEFIGSPNLPKSVDPADFIGAEREGTYLMPRSAFVAANTCYETHYMKAYNDYCFCIRKKARNPDAPFGKTFIAWTQYLFINLGNNSCRLYCSVEPEFPNGEPMVSRQIRSGMRAGTGGVFVLTGETITKYADEYP